jgi:hypothetical protein
MNVRLYLNNEIVAEWDVKLPTELLGDCLEMAIKPGSVSYFFQLSSDKPYKELCTICDNARQSLTTVGVKKVEVTVEDLVHGDPEKVWIMVKIFLV